MRYHGEGFMHSAETSALLCLREDMSMFDTTQSLGVPFQTQRWRVGCGIVGAGKVGLRTVFLELVQRAGLILSLRSISMRRELDHTDDPESGHDLEMSAVCPISIHASQSGLLSTSNFLWTSVCLHVCSYNPIPNAFLQSYSNFFFCNSGFHVVLYSLP